jgi:sterol desaturase/sphingolipid hydroxylase (fatty acid hydroxylase superfamily)
LSSELALRLGGFLGVLVILLVLESVPRVRARAAGHRLVRAGRHFGLSLISSVMARVMVPAGLAGVAVWAQTAGFGVFNLLVLPPAAAFVATLLVMDFAVWFQHRAMHHVPILWHLHRLHHADTEMDVTTGLRFHPFEILLSLGFKAMVAALLGAPPEAVLAYEVMLNAMALFTHANITLHERVDRALRRVIATPAFHLVHHSPRAEETNSNYANALTVWDHLFGTSRTASVPDPGLGLERFRAPEDQRFAALLRQPFKP